MVCFAVCADLKPSGHASADMQLCSGVHLALNFSPGCAAAFAQEGLDAPPEEDKAPSDELEVDLTELQDLDDPGAAPDGQQSLSDAFRSLLQGQEVHEEIGAGPAASDAEQGFSSQARAILTAFESLCFANGQHLLAGMNSRRLIQNESKKASRYVS